MANLRVHSQVEKAQAPERHFESLQRALESGTIKGGEAGRRVMPPSPDTKLTWQQMARIGNRKVRRQLDLSL